MNVSEKHALELASKKGASNCLTALPLSRYNSNLNKSEFRDGIYLITDGTNQFSIHMCMWSIFWPQSPLHCAKGGYTHMRHDEIKDSFGILMSELCYEFKIGPKLQSLQAQSFVNKSIPFDEDARLDVKANGLWDSRFIRTFFDVKVFNPHAKTSRRLLQDAYKYHESLKTSKYQQRILQFEQSSFCPPIYGCARMMQR